MQLSTQQNGSLYYEVIDLTPPWLVDPQIVVFSHGVGTNSEIWNAWLRHLIPYFKLIRFDTRGFGRSSRHGPGFAWSFDLWADDILAVADAAQASRFHLVAESLAGAVSLHLASRDTGDRLLSVTTCSSPYRGSDLPRVTEWRRRLEEGKTAAWSSQMMEQRFYPGALSDAALAWFAKEQETSDPDTLLALGDLLLHLDLSDALPRISVPVLLIAADASPYVTVDIASAMKKLIRKADLEIIPHSRHGIPFSHADACAQAFLNFARQQRFIPETDN